MSGLRFKYFFFVVFFTDDYEVYIDNTDLLFVNGTNIGVHWSPISILPVVDPENYSVDIKLMESPTTGSRELALLGTNLPNTGFVSVTVPPMVTDVVRNIRNSITPVFVQVSISSNSTTGVRPGTDSDILRSVGNLSHQPLKHSPIRYVKMLTDQEEQQQFCAEWEESQQSAVTRNRRFGALPPCPRNIMVARAPNSGYIEERRSSRVRVMGTIPGFSGDRIVDDEHRQYFNPGASACFLQRSVSVR